MKKNIKTILTNFHNRLAAIKELIQKTERDKCKYGSASVTKQVNDIINKENLYLQEEIAKVLTLKSTKDALFCASTLVDMFKINLEDVGRLKGNNEYILNELDKKLYNMEKECKLKNLK